MTPRSSHLAILFVLTVATLPLSSWTAFVDLPSISRHSPGQHRCALLPSLVCKLRPTAGNVVSGTVRFTAERDGRYPAWYWFCPCVVRVQAILFNLSEGSHGFHIHSYGDERFANGSSAGGHFPNPWFISEKHGLPFNAFRHWGDLGNVVANAKGYASLNRIDRVISLRGIVGRGMIVHAGKDMGAMAQPSGGAGARQASCVIGYGNPSV